jgi:hypothetical protein
MRFLPSIDVVICIFPRLQLIWPLLPGGGHEFEVVDD